LIRHDRPVINGDGNFSRDFTYIDNVIQANEKAALAPSPVENGRAGVGVLNIAFGEKITLNELFQALRDNMAKFDPEIARLEPIYGPVRAGDIPHSLAAIDKARKMIGYAPQDDAIKGFEKACEWYWNSLR